MQQGIELSGKVCGVVSCRMVSYGVVRWRRPHKRGRRGETNDVKREYDTHQAQHERESWEMEVAFSFFGLVHLAIKVLSDER